MRIIKALFWMIIAFWMPAEAQEEIDEPDIRYVTIFFTVLVVEAAVITSILIAG